MSAMDEFGSRWWDLAAAVETRIPFKFQADAKECQRLAQQLRLLSLKRFTFAVTVTEKRRLMLPQSTLSRGFGWHLQGEYTADVLCRCVISNAPMPMSIARTVDVTLFDEAWETPESVDLAMQPGFDAVAMRDQSLDTVALIAEYLALEIPDYPQLPTASIPRQWQYDATGIAADDDYRPDGSSEGKTRPFARLLRGLSLDQ